MSCRLTQSITKEECLYSVAGIKALYLLNYDSAIEYKTKGGTGDDKNYISQITLPTNDKAYKIDFVNNTASFSDELAENGNGGKYRTHTVNFTLENYDYQTLNAGDGLSLGKFVAVLVDKKNNVVILGRNNGLSATSFNYASGAAEADANGWTVILAGSELEIAQRLVDESVISTLVADNGETRSGMIITD